MFYYHDHYFNTLHSTITHVWGFNTNIQSQIEDEERKSIKYWKHVIMCFVQKNLEFYTFKSISLDRHTEGSSARVPPGHTNFAILKTVPGTPLTIEHNSVLSSTANSSEAGTTLGDHTLEWMVRKLSS